MLIIIICYIIINDKIKILVVVHASNFSTQEAEAGGYLSWRPACSTRASSRTNRTVIQRNLFSKRKKERKEERKNERKKERKKSKKR